MSALRISCIALALVCAGCRTEQAPHARREVRPPLKAGPTTGELFEGPLRVHTRGKQGDALNCSVSPLGDLLAFSWNNYQPEPKIYVVPAAGGPPRQITFGPWPDVDPAFLPGDDPQRYRIAFASRREGNFDIYLIPVDGGGPSWQLTADPADELHPTFSPDGRLMAFCRLDRDGVWKIWTKDLQTQQETLLGPGKNPEWSPTGTHLAFQLPAGRLRPLWSVWIMKSDGTDRTQIFAAGDAWAVHPTWSPDGRFLAFTKLEAQTEEKGPPAGDIWIYDLQTGLSFRLTSAASLDADPYWSLDGWIYFSSTRTTGTFNILSGQVRTALLKPGLAEQLLGDQP